MLLFSWTCQAQSKKSQRQIPEKACRHQQCISGKSIFFSHSIKYVLLPSVQDNFVAEQHRVVSKVGWHGKWTWQTGRMLLVIVPYMQQGDHENFLYITISLSTRLLA